VNGLLQPGGRGDRAVSYFVGLHGLPEYPAELVGGDFGIGGMESQICGLVGRQVWLLSGINTSVAWTNYGHWSTGNLLLNDGQVRQTTSAQLRALLQSPNKFESNQTHLVVPNKG
jgi:hypothetical protein